jgi:hypothetical protein
MGYDLHVTRAEEWYQSKMNPISLEEWVAYVRSDPEMRLEGYAEASVPNEGTLGYVSEGLAVWTAYSGGGKGGNFAWFDFQRGEVVVKNPDEEIIGKMCSVAKALSARVQGDDGEFYGEDLNS